MTAVRETLSRVRADESGMGMLEVLVSALILAVISLGVLKTFDAANAQSGYNKSRGVAANLATEDLERLRGYRASELTGLNSQPPRERWVAGVKYTVASTATWLSDDSGSRSCTSDGKQIEYVKLTSKVTWPGIKTDAQAVSQSTLYAPPKGSFGTQGAMAIQVLDRNGVGVGGVAVTATGPANLSANTDTLGCAYFPYIATGDDYTVSISKNNYIDPTGSSNPSATVGVSAENVTTQQFDFDQRGSIAGTVQTRRSATNVRNVPSGSAVLSHTQLDTPRTAALSGTGTFSFANVFPFTGAYYASPGNCDGPSPLGAAQLGAQEFVITPLQSKTGVALYKPSAKVVANGTVAGVIVSNMFIELIPKTSTGGCGEKTYWGKAETASNNVSWWLSPSSAGSADTPGTTYNNVDSSVAYGTYDACISAQVNASGYVFTAYWKAADNPSLSTTSVALTKLDAVDTLPISKDPYSSSNRNGYGTSAGQVGC